MQPLAPRPLPALGSLSAAAGCVAATPPLPASQRACTPVQAAGGDQPDPCTSVEVQPEAASCAVAVDGEVGEEAGEEAGVGAGAGRKRRGKQPRKRSALAESAPAAAGEKRALADAKRATADTPATLGGTSDSSTRNLMPRGQVREPGKQERPWKQLAFPLPITADAALHLGITAHNKKKNGRG